MWVKAIALVIITGALGTAVLLAALGLEHNKQTILPKPTGLFAVGRAMYAWSDATQTDALASEPGAKRELVAWIWYPAIVRQSLPTAEEYLPPAWRAAVQRARGTLITQFLTRDLSKVKVHSIRDVEVSPLQRSYPVIIMRAGLAAMTTDYTILAEDLASHGYVVVGFDSPYRSTVTVFPDGRVIARSPQNNADAVPNEQQNSLLHKLVVTWSADVGFALDQLERLNGADPSGPFAGRLDLQRVGIFGHSLGGATALQFCHDDLRCRAGIDIDGAPRASVVGEGVSQAFMFLMGDHGNMASADNREIEANIRSIYDRLPQDRRVRIMIRGANHFGFSDGSVLKSQLVMRALRMLGILGIDGRRQLALTAHYVHSFFDVYLKGVPDSQLKSRSAHPEIEHFE